MHSTAALPSVPPARVVGLLGSVLIAAACAAPTSDRGLSQTTPALSSPVTEARDSSTTPSPTPVPAEWEWQAEPSDAAHAHDDVTAEAGEPEGEALDEAGSDTAPDVVADDPAAEAGWVDPCTLITDVEWAEWTGDAALTTPEVLEDGDACGWISAEDDVRMAIAAFLTAGSVRWLSADDFAAGEAVSGLGDRAVWLPDWPIEQSSTLVVEAGTLDLVIEMSARDPSGDAALREGAVEFARLALGRLP